MAVTSIYIQQNNERREKLNERNKEFYSDILLYVRGSNVDQRAAEELLLELLEHLIEAQEAGRSAEHVFGRDPEGYCKALVDQLPKPSLVETLLFWTYMVSIAASWFFAPITIAVLIFPDLNYDLGGVQLAVIAGVVIVLPLTIMFVLKKSIFSTWGKNKERLIWLLAALCIIFIPYLIVMLVPASFKIEMSFPLLLTLTLIFLLLRFVLKKRVMD